MYSHKLILLKRSSNMTSQPSIHNSLIAEIRERDQKRKKEESIVQECEKSNDTSSTSPNKRLKMVSTPPIEVEILSSPDEEAATTSYRDLIITQKETMVATTEEEEVLELSPSF